jgi:hypothetical protein
MMHHGRRLQTLKDITPYEYIGKVWASKKERFTLDPLQHVRSLPAF